MTAVFRLYHNTDYVDFIGGDAKATLEHYASYAEGDRVTEVFNVFVKDTTRANVRAELNAVITMLEKAVKWHATGLEQYPVWLRFYTDGETAKQALVYAYELQPVQRGGITHMLETGTGLYTFWHLAITRDREWEDTTAAGTSIGTLNGNGHAYNGTAVTGGHVDARIKYLLAESPTASVNKFWFGIHRLRTGAVADLDGVIDIAAVYTGTDTTIAAEAGSYNANSAQVTFASNTNWLARAYATLPNDGAADPSAMHYTGRWLVLLRARVGSGTAAMVRLSVSADDIYLYGVQPTLLHQGPAVYIDSSEHHLYEMGEIQLPATGWRYDAVLESMAKVRLNLEARRVTGTGTLYADCFIMIPAEHMVAVTGIELQSLKTLSVNTEADGSVVAVIYDDSGGVNASIEGIGAVTAHNWRWPKEGGVLITAFERGSGHVLADTAVFVMSRLSRWLGYHG